MSNPSPTSSQEETIIATENIYDGRIVKLRLHTVRLPSGKEAKREVIYHSGAVCIVPMVDNETVLLVRQWRVPANRALLEIPAGGLEPNESPEECARRELVEEVGQRAGRMVPLWAAFLAPGYTSEFMHAFLALDLSPQAGTMDEDENIEIVRMSLADALAAIPTGEIADAKTIAGLTMAAHLLRTLATQ